ncbi:hypothetical protein K1X76_08450 [bacterium]|nr:hypothetical protein [bacterium]
MPFSGIISVGRLVVERIDKLRETDYLRVDASAESQKDREQEDGGQQDNFQGLSDKTDWKLLLDKSKLWKKNIQIPVDDIEVIYYRKVNLKTDPSLLRIDLTLKNGEKIAPAFLAISRMAALQIKDLKSGDPLKVANLTRDNILQVTIPLNPALFKDEAKPVDDKKETTDGEITVTQHVVNVNKIVGNKGPNKSPEMLIIYGLIALVVVLVIGVILFFF